MSLNQIPLLRFLIPFVTGIIFAVYNEVDSNIPYVLLGVLIVFFIFIFSFKKINQNYTYRWIFGSTLLSIFLFLGYGVANLTIQESKTDLILLTKNETIFIGKIIETPLLKANTIKTTLAIQKFKIDNQWRHANSKILAYIKRSSLSDDLIIGDLITFKSKLNHTAPPKNPNEFDYKKYLSFHSIHLQTFLNNRDWSKISSSKSIFTISNNIRKSLINILQKKGVKGEELTVASALILGYKDEIDPQLKKAYSSAGAMHILAVSGLHVGVIFLIFSRLLKFIDKIKYGTIIKGISLILILWIYALLTGLSPSVMRAATMFSFIILGKISQREGNFFNTISASAFVLLIYNPLLIMEVGFQLSYLAVIGIVIIQPWVYSWLNSKWWLFDKVWEITAVSIAAQIATFPLSLLYFHQFPNYFMLSNLIIIPLAFIILYLGLTALMLSAIPILSDYLILVLRMIIQFLNKIVLLIDRLPYALSENIRFNIYDTWLVYLIIISIILMITYKKFLFFASSSLLILTFLMINTWLNHKHINQKEVIIYNIANHSAINLISGKQHILLTEKSLIDKRKQLLFHVQNNWIEKEVGKEKVILLENMYSNANSEYQNKHLFIEQNYFQFYDLKVAIIDDRSKLSVTNKKINLDLLILTKTSRFKLKELLSIFNVKTIIIDSSNSAQTSLKYKKEANNLDVNCWSILIDGSFSKKL